MDLKHFFKLNRWKVGIFVVFLVLGFVVEPILVSKYYPTGLLPLEFLPPWFQIFLIVVLPIIPLSISAGSSILSVVLYWFLLSSTLYHLSRFISQKRTKRKKIILATIFLILVVAGYLIYINFIAVEDILVH